MINPIFIVSLLLPVMVPAAVLPAQPLFTISDIIYSSSTTYSTPAHRATTGGTISFNLTNKALPYTTHCTATGMRYPGFFYGEMVYQCDTPTGAGVGPVASANFTFSYPGGVFSVNQTWGAGDSPQGEK
jgi:hypothetical protein